MIHIIIFECCNYKEDSKYHLDNFGSLVRYFPIFDFNNNDTNNVIICDIELN